MLARTAIGHLDLHKAHLLSCPWERNVLESRSAMRSVALVVVEPEGDWPSWIVWRGLDIVAVLDRRDAEDEKSASGCSIDQRVARLSRPVSLAVLACGPREDSGTSAHRVATAEALLTGVAAAERGHLVINASGRASSELRRALMALTTSLGQRLPGNARVSLRCGGVVRIFPARPRERQALPGSHLGPSLARSVG